MIHLVNRLIKQVVNDFCNWSFNVDACENKIPHYYENQPMSSVQLDDKVHHGLSPKSDLIAGKIPTRVRIIHEDNDICIELTLY